MNKILEFEKFNTYPEELKNVIKDNITDLSQIYNDTIISGLSSSHYFEGHFNEEYKNKPIKNRTKIIQTIDKTLSNHYIVGFHITRLIDDTAIIKNGLKTLKTDYYLRYMKYVFQTILHYNTEKTNIALNQLYNYLTESRQNSRLNTISLFAPPSEYVINIRDNGFNLLYGDIVGGEIAKMSLSNEFKDDLSKIGETKVIQFLFPFNSLKTFGELPKDFAINQIIFFALQHILEEKLIKNAIFQTQITQSIPPQDIIKIWTPNDIVDAYNGKYKKINGKFQKLKL